MEKILDLITGEVERAFTSCGYDKKYGKVTLSNRPDLCEYQCNGALAAAKEYRKAPFLIAEEVEEALSGNAMFELAECVKPGFLNLKLDAGYLADYLNGMLADPERFGCERAEKPRRVILDYGGANVAKPLHVGHLRSAIIGESVKRIGRFMGDEVIGDVHLGDWGLQMGLIITELRERKPGLCYFDENYSGEYPKDAPFTISELEEIYPAASARAGEDAAYREAAMQATYELQQGRRGYGALLSHIMNVSVADLKKNYDSLDVSFDLWKGEKDAQPYIPDMVRRMKEEGYAYVSDGALVVDVKEEGDAREIPPCMILKSDGASLYNTTDLATIVWRMEDYHPDEILYVVDKRQELHFIQVFRCARKAGLVGEDTKLTFLGFGTMNGKDGKPFKTREGGVMRLENLVAEINEEMYRKISENHALGEAEARETARVVALSAIKYGDLCNQASKDYIFDIDRFTSFEGNTGPYILYTIVRIKSILAKYAARGGDAGSLPAGSAENAGSAPASGAEDAKPSPAGDAENAGLSPAGGARDAEHSPAKGAGDAKPSPADGAENAGLSSAGGAGDARILPARTAGEKALMLELCGFSAAMEAAHAEAAPHKVCAFLYGLANAFNSFYHETKILTEEDPQVQAGYICLLELTKGVLEKCIDVLGFSAPERM